MGGAADAEQSPPQAPPPLDSVQDSVMSCCSARRKSPDAADHMAREVAYRKVADEVKAWKPARPTSNDQKLRLYALFKQAEKGDCTESRPGIFYPTDRAKWDAWKALEGKSVDEARAEYIDEAQLQMREHS